MSAICGIYSPSRPELASPDLLTRMLESMRLRGGDGERRWSAPGVALGLTARLSFPRPGSQSEMPWTETERGVIALDGSVYGEESGTSLVEAAVQDGRFPDALDGWFSAAVWDESSRTLSVAADTLGSRAVYYYHSPTTGLFVFATRLDALLQHADVPREIDPLSVQLFLGRGAIFAPYSIYRDVRKLLPGEVLTIGPDGALSNRIYHRQTAGRGLEASPESMQELLRDELTAAVRRTSRGMERPGVLLSSGVDSAVLLAALVDSGAKPVAYTLVYQTGSGADESIVAGDTARRLGVEHHPVPVSGTPPEVFSRLFQAYDEPIDLRRGPTNYYLAEAVAKDGITSCLSGITGENVYGGMEWDIFEEALQAVKSDQGAVDRILCRSTVLSTEDQEEFLAEYDAAAVDDRVLRPFAGLIEIDDAYERYNANLLLRIPTGRHGVSPSLVPPIFGVEQRQGFRDQRLIEFGRTLPFEAREGDSFNTSRSLVRGAFAGRLPHLVESSPKHGMPPFPWSRSGFNNLDSRFEASMERLKATGLVRPKAIDKLVRKYAEDGRSRRSAGRAWALFCLQGWIDFKVNRIDPFA